MAERIVINTGPLIALARMDALDVPGQRPNKLICPTDMRTFIVVLAQGGEMAIVRKLKRITLERDSKHSEVKDCTYSIILDDDGRRSLQIDTYGSAYRRMPDKKSQSIRFSPEAIEQLRHIVTDEV